MTAVLVSPHTARELEELVPVEIRPDVIYDSLQAAKLLGFEGETDEAIRNGVYRIPPERLTRIRRAGGGRLGFPGWAIIRYLEEQTEGRPRDVDPHGLGDESRALSRGGDDAAKLSGGGRRG